MYRPTLSTAPTSTPVSYEEVVAHLRQDADDEEELIRALLNAATAYFDGYYGVLGRALVTQSWQQKFDGWDSQLYLPVFPVASITSVTYLDTNDASQTVSSSLYTLLTDDCGGYVQFLNAFTFPSTTIEYHPAVTVTYVAGEAVISIPQSIKQAMLMLIAHWYENREAVTVGEISSDLRMATNALIAPYRRMRF